MIECLLVDLVNCRQLVSDDNSVVKRFLRTQVSMSIDRYTNYDSSLLFLDFSHANACSRLAVCQLQVNLFKFETSEITHYDQTIQQKWQAKSSLGLNKQSLQKLPAATALQNEIKQDAKPSILSDDGGVLRTEVTPDHYGREFLCSACQEPPVTAFVSDGRLRIKARLSSQAARAFSEAIGDELDESLKGDILMLKRFTIRSTPWGPADWRIELDISQLTYLTTQRKINGAPSSLSDAGDLLKLVASLHGSQSKTDNAVNNTSSALQDQHGAGDIHNLTIQTTTTPVKQVRVKVEPGSDAVPSLEKDGLQIDTASNLEDPRTANYTKPSSKPAESGLLGILARGLNNSTKPAVIEDRNSTNDSTRPDEVSGDKTTNSNDHKHVEESTHGTTSKIQNDSTSAKKSTISSEITSPVRPETQTGHGHSEQQFEIGCYAAERKQAAAKSEPDLGAVSELIKQQNSIFRLINKIFSTEDRLHCIKKEMHLVCQSAFH
ncbi:hypothetical protein MRB53_040634 [Persea americana]|nr:hypothetical protein MRB53_040634 [Persea americana]